MKVDIMEASSSSTTSSSASTATGSVRRELYEADEAGRFVSTSCFVCASPGTLANDEYPDVVSYCSQEHKGLHLRAETSASASASASKEDAEETFPFLVKHRSEVGRYLVAARDIQPGEMIFSEAPLVIGPSHSATPSCLDCMRTVDGSYLCPHCNLPVCDEMCAFGDEHCGKECRVFGAARPKVSVEKLDAVDPAYWSVSALRGLLLKETDPKKYDILKRMVDHNEHHRQDVEQWQLYKEHVVDFLRVRCGLQDKFSEDEIFHVLGVIDVNSVKIHSPRRAEEKGGGGGQKQAGWQHPGHALYPLTALISHSCLSNSKTLVQLDNSCECRATTFIQKGQEITKQYVSSMETTNMRRRKLKSGWYFDCRCPRCRDPSEGNTYTSATCCLRCRGGTILPLEPLHFDCEWICDTCQFRTNGSAVDKLVDYFLSKVHSTKVEALDDWEALLDKALKMFHSNHFVPTLIRITMNTGYIQLAVRLGMQPEDIPAEIYMRRKELLDEVHRVVELVEPGHTRRRGISLFETSTCHLQLGRLLHERDRFPPQDFIKLLAAEAQSLKECLLCLSDSPDHSLESSIHYKAEAALHEVNYMTRLMKQKKEQFDKEEKEEAELRKERFQEIQDGDDE